MMDDLEDFKAYLKGNCESDFARITQPDIKEDTINALKSRHESRYQIWQYISRNAPWVIGLYNGKLPTEVFSGQLPVENFFRLAEEMAYQNLIYNNSCVIAMRMQYTENLPNMVYSINTREGLLCYENTLRNAGYNQENTRRAIHRREESYKFCGKLESLGVSKKQALTVLKEAETINIIEQLEILNSGVTKAKTPNEKQQAAEQIKIFIDTHAQHLYNHPDELQKINGVLSNIPNDEDSKGTPPADTKEDTKCCKAPALDLSPAPKTTGNNKKDTGSIKAPLSPKEEPNIYTFLNQQLDDCVFSQLKILDNALTVKHERMPQAKGEPLPTDIPQLKDHIHVSEKLRDMNEEYLRKRALTDHDWQQRMQQLSERMTQARLHAKCLEDFTNALYQSAGIQVPETSLTQQSGRFPTLSYCNHTR